jgi:hypothetical protein
VDAGLLFAGGELLEASRHCGARLFFCAVTFLTLSCGGRSITSEGHDMQIPDECAGNGSIRRASGAYRRLPAFFGALIMMLRTLCGHLTFQSKAAYTSY